MAAVSARSVIVGIQTVIGNMPKSEKGSEAASSACGWTKILAQISEMDRISSVYLEISKSTKYSADYFRRMPCADSESAIRNARRFFSLPGVDVGESVLETLSFVKNRTREGLVWRTEVAPWITIILKT